jgi:hypothetical protein
VSTIQSVTYVGGNAATQSDTTADPHGPFAAIQNTGASATCKIQPTNGPAITIYMVQGLIYPIATKFVFSTGGLSTIIGFYDSSRFWKGDQG